MPAQMFIGIDIGTSSVKAVMIDRGQTVLATASQVLSVSRPHPGHSEQDPLAWWEATQQVLARLAADQPEAMRAVAGIGLSGQQHGAVLLDAEQAVLRPAILWNDTRSQVECGELEAALPELRQIIGNVLMPGFTAPKLRWVAKHEPRLFAQVRRVLLPKDYVRLRLTGEAVSDMSDASGTGWLDVARRDWSDAALAATGLDRSHMPRLVEGIAESGIMHGELASKFGMHGGVVVAGGAGDNAAAACGIGAVAPGSAFVSLGTSGVLFATTERFAPNTGSGVHAFCHAVPARWHQMGVILSATDSLEWLARLLHSDAASLVAALGETVAAPSPALFAPYLAGERTPHNHGSLRGGFAGLGHEADSKVLTLAVLEGVAFAFRDCLAALEAAGTRIERVWGVGGGARSRLWLRIMASVLRLPVDLPARAESGGAFGAARLALCAVSGADPTTICTPPAIAETIAPVAALADAYDAGYVRYRSFGASLKSLVTA
ncbi:xylulokinase [Lichenicoccus sp.]|uniref:xylulokinase n=1 Tax=Lichenicoccus sp. TaxID=2781899 RepID=UPI003D14378F